MPERTHRRHEMRSPGAVGLHDIFAAGDESAPMVTVAHGQYAEQLPVAGLTVGEIRARYRDRFDIDLQSQAILDGDPVDEGTTVGSDQVLTFIRRAGEKGASRRRLGRPR